MSIYGSCEYYPTLCPPTMTITSSFAPEAPFLLKTAKVGVGPHEAEVSVQQLLGS